MATVAKPIASHKSAEDELLDSFGELLDEAVEKMSHRKFVKTAKKSKAALDRAIDSHQRRDGTA